MGIGKEDLRLLLNYRKQFPNGKNVYLLKNLDSKKICHMYGNTFMRIL